MKSVMICDNVSQARSELRTMLTGLGFDVIYECSNGDDAVKSALDKLPDLAIMEILLPKKNGIVAAREIREKLKIPVIFQTACNDHETIEQAMKVDVAAFLSKPLREHELWPAIELAIAHNHEVEQLKEEITDLKYTLESRKIIERAKGVLIKTQGLSEPDAFRKMQKLAMDKRKSLRQIAEAILMTA